MTTLFDRVTRCRYLAQRLQLAVSPDHAQDASEIAHHMDKIIDIMGDSDYMFGRIDDSQPAPKRLTTEELLTSALTGNGMSPDARSWAIDVDIINLTDDQDVLIVAFMLFRHLGLRPPEKHRKVWSMHVRELIDAARGDLVLVRDGIKDALAARTGGLTIKGPKSVLGFVTNARAKKDTVGSSSAVVIDA